MIHMERHGNTGLVMLDRGVINPINLQLVTALSNAIEELKNDPEVHAMVLSSASEKFFSIGLDIPELLELDRDGMRFFFSSFNRVCMDLFLFPKPTVAAIRGHAVAGGCILTLCCDYRFIAEGRRLMGLNEILLGVPVPYLPDCILRSLVGERHARDIMDSGELYMPDDLLRMGVVDQVLPADQVVQRALDKAGLIGALPLKAYAQIKRNRVEKIEAQVTSCREEKENAFIALWFSDEAQDSLKKAVEKF